MADWMDSRSLGRLVGCLIGRAQTSWLYWDCLVSWRAVIGCVVGLSGLRSLGSCRFAWSSSLLYGRWVAQSLGLSRLLAWSLVCPLTRSLARSPAFPLACVCVCVFSLSLSLCIALRACWLARSLAGSATRLSLVALARCRSAGSLGSPFWLMGWLARWWVGWLAGRTDDGSKHISNGEVHGQTP